MWDSFGDGVPTPWLTQTHAETPDGYVKMLVEIMWQFFIPTGFMQECVLSFFFSEVEKKKFIIVVLPFHLLV